MPNKPTHLRLVRAASESEAERMRAALDELIAYQRARPTPWVPAILTYRAHQRMQVGQSIAEAVDGVLALYRELMVAGLTALVEPLAAPEPAPGSEADTATEGGAE